MRIPDSTAHGRRPGVVGVEAGGHDRGPATYGLLDHRGGVVGAVAVAEGDQAAEYLPEGVVPLPEAFAQLGGEDAVGGELFLVPPADGFGQGVPDGETGPEAPAEVVDGGDEVEEPGAAFGQRLLVVDGRSGVVRAGVGHGCAPER